MGQNDAKIRHGMILGKFMPPHAGHLFLADFARHYAERLSVLVCSIAREPIPGELRYGWMRELLPMCNVVHVTDENPQEPHEHPAFWEIWRETIRRASAEPIDYVFASESYGQKLAQVLDAQFIPVDLSRTHIRVSGTAIRTDPMGQWQHIPPCVRPYFLHRICLFGPESVGKSTLALQLADHFQTVAVGEYARPLLDHKSGRCDREDIPLIARGQIAAEDALARQANRVMFCDTDLLTTTIWSDVLFDDCPQWITEEAQRRQYDLYLLLKPDVPWVDDKQRYLPHQRWEFYERCRETLARSGRRYVEIGGDWSTRLQSAIDATQQVLSEQRGINASK